MEKAPDEMCVGDARTDDRDNALLAYEHDFCVVAISYRKGPSYGWPTAPQDCANLIDAILNDKELEGIVDKKKIAVGGYSAGQSPVHRILGH